MELKVCSFYDWYTEMKSTDYFDWRKVTIQKLREEYADYVQREVYCFIKTQTRTVRTALRLYKLKHNKEKV